MLLQRTQPSVSASQSTTRAQPHTAAHQTAAKPLLRRQPTCQAHALHPRSLDTQNSVAALLAVPLCLALDAAFVQVPPAEAATRQLTKEEIRNASGDMQGSLQGLPGTQGSDSKAQEAQMRAALAARIAANKAASNAPQGKVEDSSK